MIKFLGLSNVMIATDIVQEGLDVPECSFVIRYEFVSNEIGTVQSRGRARAEKSSCYLVVGQCKISLNTIKIYKITFLCSCRFR
jgi:ERCC4-related helicase